MEGGVKPGLDREFLNFDSLVSQRLEILDHVLFTVSECGHRWSAAMNGDTISEDNLPSLSILIRQRNVEHD